MSDLYEDELICGPEPVVSNLEGDRIVDCILYRSLHSFCCNCFEVKSAGLCPSSYCEYLRKLSPTPSGGCSHLHIAISVRLWKDLLNFIIKLSE